MPLRQDEIAEVRAIVQEMINQALEAKKPAAKTEKPKVEKKAEPEKEKK